MRKTSLFLGTIATFLIGCSSNTPKIEKAITESKEQSEAIKSAMEEKGLQLSEGAFDLKIDDGIWVETKTLKSYSVLPSSISMIKYSINKPSGMTLDELCSFITRKTGIRASWAPELVAEKEENEKSLLTQSVPFYYPPDKGVKSGDIEKDRKVVIGKYRPVVKNKTLEYILDDIAASIGVSWSYSKKDGIRFYYYQKKTLFVQGSVSNISAKVSNKATGSSSSSKGGTATQTLDVDIAPKFWEELSLTLSNYLSKNGKLSINKSIGSVTINDNEHAVNAVENYINDLNRLLKLQVHMRLMIVSLDVAESDMAALSYDLLYNNKLGSIGITTPRQNASAVSSIIGKITDPDSRFVGSQLFLDALSKRAEVTKLTTSDILISNYRPYLYRSGETTRYIGNITTTVNEGVTSESVEIEELFTGIGITFLPNIFDSENLSMDLMINQQDLNKFENVTLTNATIKLPDTNNQSLTNNFFMRNGESKVLASFEAKLNKSDNSGTLTPDNILLGGSKNAEGKRELIIIVGTPIII